MHLRYEDDFELVYNGSRIYTPGGATQWRSSMDLTRCFGPSKSVFTNRRPSLLQNDTIFPARFAFIISETIACRNRVRSSVMNV